MFIQNSQVELRPRVAFFGRFAKPLRGFGFILRNALAFAISEPKIHLPLRIARLRSLAIPTNRFRQIRRAAPSTGVETAEAHRCFAAPMFSRRPQPFRGCRAVLLYPFAFVVEDAKV